ncbi:glycosyltransferase [Neolewinella sp.]|uniref:glycosyltransferase n=1 Tax=Neolewinella sp. TaxID=2993543 RepID=UPI003B5295F6
MSSEIELDEKLSVVYIEHPYGPKQLPKFNSEDEGLPKFLELDRQHRDKLLESHYSLITARINFVVKRYHIDFIYIDDTLFTLSVILQASRVDFKYVNTKHNARMVCTANHLNTNWPTDTSISNIIDRSLRVALYVLSRKLKYRELCRKLSSVLNHDAIYTIAAETSGHPIPAAKNYIRSRTNWWYSFGPILKGIPVHTLLHPFIASHRDIVASNFYSPPHSNYRTGQHRELVTKIYNESIHKNIVYITFGSLIVHHDVGVSNRIKKVVRLFEQCAALLEKNTSFVLQIDGKDKITQEEFSYLKIVKQFHLLRADTAVNLVVCHGGLNTIIEAIYLAKPIICIPLSNNYDHHYNSHHTSRNYPLATWLRYEKLSVPILVQVIERALGASNLLGGT